MQVHIAVTTAKPEDVASLRFSFALLKVDECKCDVSPDYDLGGVVGNTSAGFSQLILNGPIPCTWRTVAPLHDAKWRMVFGIKMKLPASIGVSFEVSNTSPVPIMKVPSRTVMFSSVGCQCGGTLAPSGQRMRSTNGLPSAFGSPETLACSQPIKLGNHFRSAARAN